MDRTDEYETRMVIANYLQQAIDHDRLYEQAAKLTFDLADPTRTIYEICEVKT